MAAPTRSYMMPRYTISRNGQTYGPYSMDELQRYLASGHILPTDLARTDDATDWIPVSQVPGAFPGTATPYTASYASHPGTIPAVGYAPATFNDPPNLNWALVLLLDLFTCSLFQLIWNIVLGAWFHRVNPRSRVLALYIASGVLIIAQSVTGSLLGIVGGHHSLTPNSQYTTSYLMLHGPSYALYGLLALACWVVRLIARFTFRSELEFHYNTVDPIGLRINPILTFFFGGIYLQSVLNEVNRRKQYARMAPQQTTYIPTP